MIRLVVPLALLVGCAPRSSASCDDDPLACDPGDDTGAGEDHLIQAWEGACLDAETWEGAATLAGEAPGGGVLDLWETGAGVYGWNEEHDLPDLAIRLTQVDDFHDVADGPDGTGTTFFGCGADGQLAGDAETLTFALRAYDADGALLDCAAWGMTPEIVATGGFIDNGGGPPSYPRELDGCRVLR